MWSLALVVACTLAAVAAVLVGRRLPGAVASSGSRMATGSTGSAGHVVASLHLIGAVAGLLAWVVFLIVVGRVGETAASVVGIVGLAGWWVAAAAGLVLLARRPAPLAVAVAAHGGLLVAVGALSWAYATHVV